MSDWPALLYDGGRVETSPFTSSIPQVVSVAANNVKGSWTEFIAATSFAARALMVTFLGGGPVSHNKLIDIGIGANGSEVVLLPNLHNWSGVNKIQGGRIYYFPIAVPAGTRLSVRGQHSDAATARDLEVLLHLFSGAYGDVYAGVEDIGPNTADSTIVQVDPGGSANTKGSWAQLKSATTHALDALVVRIAGEVEPASNVDWRLDIGVGGAGSEQVVLGDLHVIAQATVGPVTEWISPPIPLSLPAGTRIAARAQCSVTTANTRNLRAACYGLY